MNWLLDTDHISILERADSHARRRLIARLAVVAESEVGFSIVSFHEQTNGCNSFIQRSRSAADTIKGYASLETVRSLYSSATVLMFDALAARTFASFPASVRRIGTMDLRIAAIAIANNLTLLTRNSVDFSRVPGLQFADWTL